MARDYTIVSARNDGEKDNPHGGKLVKWYLKLADSEAGDEEVYCQKKPGNDLVPGMETFGRLEKGEYGWRLFPESQQDGAPRASQGGSGSLSKDDYWTRRDQRDVESQARQGRAHAQEMAIRWSALVGNDRLDQLQSLTEIFHQDVQRFPLDADVGGGGSAVEAPSQKPLADGDAAADVSADNRKWAQSNRQPDSEEASTAQKRRLTQEFNRLQLAREAQKAIVLYRCRSEKATKDGASQLIKDITEGATAESLLAEISDGRRAGNPLAARAAALIPTDVPNAEPPPEPEPPNGDNIPF